MFNLVLESSRFLIWTADGFVYYLLKKTKTENAFVYKKNYIVSVEKKKIIVLSSECVLLFRSKTIQRNKRRIFKEKLLLKGFVNPYEIVPNISKVIKFKNIFHLEFCKLVGITMLCEINQKSSYYYAAGTSCILFLTVLLFRLPPWYIASYSTDIVFCLLLNR